MKMKKTLLLFCLSMWSLLLWSENPTALFLRNTLLFSDNERTPIQLTPIVTPTSADASVIWSSSNSQVATVENGLVTPIGVGTATITAKSTFDGSITGTSKVTVLEGDNLIPDWDGNGIIGNGSEMNLFGWSSTLNADTTNGVSGYIFQPTTGTASNSMRYDPQRKMTDASGETAYVRTAILRLKSTATVQYPVFLQANIQYRFTGRVAYGSNGQTYTIDMNETKSSLGKSLAKKTVVTNGSSVKTNTLYPYELTFKPQQTGIHYICFGTANSSTQNGFVTDMVVQSIQASVTLRFEDVNGNMLKPNKTITGLYAGSRFDVDAADTQSFQVEDKTYYFDINNSFAHIESLQEGKNELKLIFSDQAVTPSSSVTLYFQDAAGKEIKEPKFITDLIPGSSFTISQEDKGAITWGGNVYLFDTANSETSIESLVQGKNNSLTLKFTQTTLLIRSTLFFFNNKTQPYTLAPIFTPVADNQVYWRSDDPSVATVENGVVTPVGKGIAVISAISTQSDDLISNCVVFVKSTDNLMVNWDGGESTGEGSEMNNFGWSCTLDANPEGGATGLTFDPTTGSAATAHRYDPNRKAKDDLGNVFYGRTAIIRLKNSSTMNYPVQLEAGKSYRLSGRMMFNASDASHTIGVYTQVSRKGTALRTATISTNSGTINKLNPVNLTFTATTTGTHYIGIATQNSGILTTFLADMFIEEITSSVNIQYVDENWNKIKEDVVITGLNPGDKYEASEALKANFEHNGSLYIYNKNSFTTIDKLLEGSNALILQFTKDILLSINQSEFSLPIKKRAYYLLNGQFLGDVDANMLDKGIYIRRLLFEDGSQKVDKIEIK